MEKQESPQDDARVLNLARQRIMDYIQCSEKEATERLMGSIQAVLDCLDNPKPPQSPHPEPLVPPQKPLAQVFPLQGDAPGPPVKKKPYYVDFELGTRVASHIPHTLSEYAVGKIEAIEYVELWYFTSEGCREAGELPTPSVTINFLDVLDTKAPLAFRPIKTTKASPNAISDERLAWEQIMTGKLITIFTANRVGWDDKLTLALAQFYINLERLKAQGYKPKALILYQTVVRRLWHEALRGRGTPLNISIFNEELFANLENQIRDSEREELVREAAELERQASNTIPLPMYGLAES